MTLTVGTRNSTYRLEGDILTSTNATYPRLQVRPINYPEIGRSWFLRILNNEQLGLNPTLVTSPVRVVIEDSRKEKGE